MLGQRLARGLSRQPVLARRQLSLRPTHGGIVCGTISCQASVRQARPSGSLTLKLALAANPRRAFASASTSHGPLRESLLPEYIVHNRLVVRAQPFLGNFAYAALASGFLMTDILTLRLLLVGGYTGLVTYHALQRTPMRIPLRWSAFFVAVNLYMVVQLVRDLHPSEFSEEDEALYAESFDQLSRGQFRRLIEAGERVTLPNGATLTVEREVCDRLFFILDGSATMSLNGQHTTTIHRGGFVNTLAAQQELQRHKSMGGVPSYGTIRSRGETRAIVWELQRRRERVGSPRACPPPRTARHAHASYLRGLRPLPRNPRTTPGRGRAGVCSVGSSHPGSKDRRLATFPRPGWASSSRPTSSWHAHLFKKRTPRPREPPKPLGPRPGLP